MKTEGMTIDGIPAVLWGPPSDRRLLAVHGDQSHKADAVIAVLAGEAAGRGFQTVSFDLPGHGDRTETPERSKVWHCVHDVRRMARFVRAISAETGLFGCSLGAYYGMLACREEPVGQALLLSPVVDMKRLIEDMMRWFDVSPERLAREGAVQTPARTLYRDVYAYVAEHPVAWDVPTALLYGGRDEVSPPDAVRGFVRDTGANLTVLEDGEHYFHTDAQLAFFRKWVSDSIAWLSGQGGEGHG